MLNGHPAEDAVDLATTAIDACARDDGRVDIEIPPALSNRLSKLPDFEDIDATPESPPSYRAHNQPIISLNILIQVIGSRGDIQPFIALANELQKHGHRIRLATHDIFADFVMSSGIEFYPVGGDPSELMAYMVKNPGLIPSMESLRAGDIQSKRKMVAQMLDGFWDSCIQPDPKTGAPFVANCIIANPPSFAHVHCAQALGVPLHMMFTMPWTSTGAFPHPLANMTISDTNRERDIANYLSYDVVEFLTWQGLGDIVNTWRQTKLGLERVPLNEGHRLLKSLEVPFTYCWSPSLIPKPREWGHNIDISGFFFRQPPAYEPPSDLDAFLQKGNVPIYVGFGSIVVGDPDRLMTMVLKAINTLKVRAVISRGWSKLEGEKHPDIFYIDDCPHDWLFQHVSAVVHHGGAGTTAVGLLNAQPTVIVPFFGDQQFWGQRIAKAGAGPEPIPYSSLTSINLTEAIGFALNPGVKVAVQQLSRQMRSESGVEAAVTHFHSKLPLERLMCDVIPELPASWTYKGKHNQVLMSKRAERLLTRSHKLDQKKLKFHQPKPIYIESQRWDPITAAGSASVDVATTMADAAAGIFVKPYETIKENRADGESSDTASQSIKRKSDSAAAKRAIQASSKSLGKLVTASTKGILIDIPIAITDGLRAVPHLYGEDVRHRGNITGFKSGAVVAGKNFCHGMFEAITDVAVYTYHGKREEQAIGAAKGLGKGMLNLVTKTTAATIGLVTYPAQGLQRSIHAAVMTKTPNMIQESMRVEGDWILGKTPASDDETRGVVADFQTFCGSKTAK
ncbi:uncharacterized protein BKA55DRAFT_598536 [Fusarium redolens]|uniref:Glycosyltransferase family 28 N-terminal domain-containing protein n=1 Tax=Fusarium redolens TaxID=48865 RepID=A0A9P9G2W9_FUSRE|nr:uncharacterized protein BKA55DRAFT_598536 [Fusarium redolens]KAH7231233.1 hypothetical protein BKA55DRAFT_598536 [Fusarium redolens]